MAVMSQALVAKYVLSLRDAQSSFKGFVQLHYPTWTLADFQLELIQALDDLESGKLGVNNLLITNEVATFFYRVSD